MNIKDIRLNNLELLIQTEGGRNVVAEKVDTSPVYISQIRSATNKRTCGDGLARRLELAFDKPRGWMDTPHTQEIREPAGEYRKAIAKGSLEKNLLAEVITLVENIKTMHQLDISSRDKAEAIVDAYEYIVAKGLKSGEIMGPVQDHLMAVTDRTG
ncbi:MAG: hypothetical protein OIF55_16785 [Amphritea sp.]|nr:hypothetical protein [Amphritea sp.]